MDTEKHDRKSSELPRSKRKPVISQARAEFEAGERV